jgi:peptidoglycan hydrolase-like protein with peptidoglycan-binding domain
MSLQQSSQGKAVADVQTALKRHGFGIGDDRAGVFGAGTESAVRSFQERHGLTVDGVVGQTTWKALGLRGSVPRPTPID